MLSTSNVNAHASGEFSKRQRRDSIIDEGEREAKVPKYGWRMVILEPESQKTDDDVEIESNYSIQDNETDFVRDTSDTCTHSEDSVDSSIWRAGELEVESYSEDDVDKDDGSTSSGSNDFMERIGEMICIEDRGLLADSSASSDLYTSSDSEVPRADYWACMRCHAKNNNPRFRYCEKCFQVRKSFFLPRPRGKKKNPRHDVKSQKVESSKLSFKKNDCEAATSSDLSSDEEDSKILRTVTGRSQVESLPRSVQSWLSESCRSQSTPSQESLPTTNQSTLSQASLPTTNQSQSTLSSSQETLPDMSQSPQVLSQDNMTLCSSQETYLPCSSQESCKPSSPFSSQEYLVSAQSSASTSVAPLAGSSEVGHLSGLSSVSQEVDSELCIICLTRPRDGVFAHRKWVHRSCCYECAKKVWRKTKRCPECNGVIKYVFKMAVERTKH